MITTTPTTTPTTQQRDTRHPVSCELSEYTWCQMPIRKEQGTKKKVVTAYNDSVELLRYFHNQMAKLVSDAVTANIQVFAQKERLKALFDEAKQQFKVPKWEFVDPELLNWDVTALPVPELLALCRETVKTETTRLTDGFFNLLAEMVELNYFGICQWHEKTEDSAMYYFFRCVASESHVRSRYEKYLNRIEKGVTGNRWMEVWEHIKHHKVFRQKLVYERHEHHLYEANTRDFNHKMQMPLFIKELRKRVPNILLPFVKIVEGDMCKEEIKISTILEKTLEEECGETAQIIEYERLASPAVVIDRYVLSGWADRDLR